MRVRAAAIVVAGTVAAVLAGPGQANAASWWLDLSPGTGPAGTEVAVSGYGFDYQRCAGPAS